MGDAEARQPTTDVSTFITDANPMVCHLMASALRRSSYALNVVGFATDSESTLSVFESKIQIDVVVISAHLREGRLAGLKLARKIRASYPRTQIIALLDFSERTTVLEAFRSGCNGIFSREQQFEMLCKCILVVQQGQVWANSREMKFLLDAVRDHGASSATLTAKVQNGRALLTDREQGLVRLVAEGLSNRDISRQLKLSEHTVRNYLFRIFNKVGTSNRIELALYAIHHGKIDQEEARQAG